MDSPTSGTLISMDITNLHQPTKRSEQQAWSSKENLSGFAQSLGKQLLLLAPVAARRAMGGTCGARPAHNREGMLTKKPIPEYQVQITPGAHILRFFLYPINRCLGRK